MLQIDQYSCPADTVKIAVVRIALPNAYAGTDATICGNTSYTLAEATAQNYSSVQWSTLGDGTFDNSALLNATYTPGTADNAAGFVDLVLTALPNAPCAQPSRDTVRLTIIPAPVAIAGPNDTLCWMEIVYLDNVTISSLRNLASIMLLDGDCLPR